MKDYYNDIEDIQVYGYGYKVQQGSGIWSTLFKKAADVFTKKAIEETGKKVVEEASKKALEEGTKILVDKATKKTGELVNKYLVGEEKPVVLKEKTQNKMTKEELQQMRKALKRIKLQQMKKLDDEEDSDYSD
jgi:hypothetical protein